MPRDIPAVRIFPMSDKIPGFVGRSIESVQRQVFLRNLVANGGRYRYGKSGLSADPGTVVLFQFKARIIASGVFLRDEKFERPRRGSSGEMYFDPASFRTFDPLDVEAMRTIWPAFRSFGHVKQYLNPTLYPTFKRRLKHVMSSSGVPRRRESQ
jgi:hypothetical protein